MEIQFFGKPSKNLVIPSTEITVAIAKKRNIKGQTSYASQARLGSVNYWKIASYLDDADAAGDNHQPTVRQHCNLSLVCYAVHE